MVTVAFGSKAVMSPTVPVRCTRDGLLFRMTYRHDVFEFSVSTVIVTVACETGTGTTAFVQGVRRLAPCLLPVRTGILPV